MFPRSFASDHLTTKEYTANYGILHKKPGLRSYAMLEKDLNEVIKYGKIFKQASNQVNNNDYSPYKLKKFTLNIKPDKSKSVIRLKEVSQLKTEQKNKSKVCEEIHSSETSLARESYSPTSFYMNYKYNERRKVSDDLIKRNMRMKKILDKITQVSSLNTSNDYYNIKNNANEKVNKSMNFNKLPPISTDRKVNENTDKATIKELIKIKKQVALKPISNQHHKKDHKNIGSSTIRTNTRSIMNNMVL